MTSAEGARFTAAGCLPAPAALPAGLSPHSRDPPPKKTIPLRRAVLLTARAPPPPPCPPSARRASSPSADSRPHVKCRHGL